MNGPRRADVLDAFSAAGQAFVELVQTVPDTSWGKPGLGEWSVRELVGHAWRAFVTAQEYLTVERPPEAEAAVIGGYEGLDEDRDPIGGAGAYFLATTGNPDLSAQVAARGRNAAAELGDDPAATVAQSVRAGLEAVTTAPDGAVFVTRFGVIGFTTYLCTRVVEAVVHSLDIARACHVEMSVPGQAERLALAVMAETARRAGHGSEVIGALGGRSPLPGGFSLFG